MSGTPGPMMSPPPGEDSMGYGGIPGMNGSGYSGVGVSSRQTPVTPISVCHPTKKTRTFIYKILMTHPQHLTYTAASCVTF